jgi:transcriptional regulator with XRE-family HTH domain
MTDEKKQSANASTNGEPAQPGEGKEPWRQWKVKPDLAILFFQMPDPRATEIGIGKRIAYCRGQLDNLSVEALARYTKYFDSAGISKASLVRYEAGDSLPGARELRILCDTLWVPPQWLLCGTIEPNSQNAAASTLISALTEFVRGATIGGTILDIDAALGISREDKEAQKKQEIEQRQRWIDEARKPSQR